MVQDVSNAVVLAISDALRQTALFLPNLIAAIVVFLVGVIIAVILKNALVRALEALGVERAIKGTAVTTALNRANSNLTLSKVFGELLKWFVILVFLVPAVDTLGLNQVSGLISSLLLYIPNVVVAVIVVTIGFLFANFAHDFVLAASIGLGTAAASFIAQIARWSIVIFALLAALTQLGIAEGLIQILFTGIIAMIALAGGLAFGLGGQEAANNLIKRVQDEVSRKR
jgi:hypothetical protein